jgi:hypothetical protein
MLQSNKILIHILSHLFYHWLIYILQFYYNICFVMWDPTSIEIEILLVVFAYKFQVCIHLMKDKVIQNIRGSDKIWLC